MNSQLWLKNHLKLKAQSEKENICYRSIKSFIRKNKIELEQFFNLYNYQNLSDNNNTYVHQQFTNWCSDTTTHKTFFQNRPDVGLKKNKNENANLKLDTNKSLQTKLNNCLDCLFNFILKFGFSILSELIDSDITQNITNYNSEIEL